MSEQVETIQDHSASTTVKRRGILAAAGAVVAGMVAKQTSQPVAADTTDSRFVANGSTGIGFYTSGIFEVGVDGIGSTAGVLGQGTGSSSAPGVSGTGGGPNGVGVVGNSAGTGAGVKGIGQTGVEGLGGGDTSSNTTGYPMGVRGSVINNGYGVYGNAGNGAGMYGECTGGYGVGGIAAGGDGINGQSTSGTGVKGISYFGFPIIGNVSGPANNAAGVLGAGTKGPGVQGQSTGGHGLVGTTNDTGGHAGLIGNANNVGGIGLMGISPGNGTTGNAGVFYGNVQIIGGALSAPLHNTEVKHASDGTYRTLYGVASPEGWFEDFGKGKFVNGSVDVTLDADFAALIYTDDYHVFLSEIGSQHHLTVMNLSPTGFTVAADAALASTKLKRPTELNGAFSYRVVARRKDIAGARLAKVAAPTTPNIPTAFEIPKTPVVTPPDKKP